MGCVPPGSLVADPRRKSLYLVVRMLDPDTYLVIEKYRAGGQGPWRLQGLGQLQRLIRSYSPREVAMLEDPATWEHDPRYGVTVPTLSIMDYHVVYNSFNVNDSDIATRLAELDAALPPWLSGLWDRGCLGLTGSLLAGMHHRWSDVDLLLDISACPGEPAEPPLGVEKDTGYLLREARTRGLSVTETAALTPPWQRFVYRGVVFSLALISRSHRCHHETRMFTVGNKEWRGTIHVEPLQPSVGDYPVLVEAGANELGSVLLVSFDGFYAAALYTGGRFAVDAVLGTVKLGGEERKALFIGLRERQGFLRRTS